MKISKNRSKINGRSITCSYIWLINTSKCVYLLDIHFVKVITNAVHFWAFFSHIGQCFWLAQTKSLENRKSGHVIMIISNIVWYYGIFLVNISRLYISWCGVLQTDDDDRQNSRITVRQKHFLFLSDSCLYMVHLGL